MSKGESVEVRVEKREGEESLPRRSKMSLTKEFMILIALFEIPVSG